MNEQVLCKDCKHSFRTISGIFAHGFNSEYAYLCRQSYRAQHQEPNPVVGAKKVAGHYENCGIARIGGDRRNDRCGVKGAWWEPKNKKDLFKYIKHVSN